MLSKLSSEKMSYSLLCGPLRGIYDYSSWRLTNMIFAVLLQVREGPCFAGFPQTVFYQRLKAVF